jgi:cell division protein FtsQ
MKRFFIFLVFALLSAGILAAVLAWSPLLEIRTMDVTGQNHCKVGDIVAASGLKTGSHPFFPIRLSRGKWPLLHITAAAEAVGKLPWVAKARVDWIPLHTVRIHVTERVPFMTLPYLGGGLLLDESGVVLESAGKEPAAGIKELRGIRYSGYVNGRVPEMADPELLKTGIRVLQTLRSSGSVESPELYDAVRWVDVISADRVIVSLEDRVTVQLDPTVELQYAVDFTNEIFFRHIGPEEKGMIDFTRGEDPAFIPD